LEHAVRSQRFVFAVRPQAQRHEDAVGLSLGWEPVNEALQSAQGLWRQRNFAKAVHLSQDTQMCLATGANNVPGAKSGQLLSTKSAVTEELRPNEWCTSP
jgi:hypothetical protein